MTVLKSTLGMAAYACNPIAWQVGAGGTLAQSQTRLHSEFEASQGYIQRHCFSKKKQASFVEPTATIPSVLYLLTHLIPITIMFAVEIIRQ